MCCRMQSRREYNPFHNALDKPESRPSSLDIILPRVAMKTKDVAKVLTIYISFFLVAASVHVYYFYFCIVTVFSNFTLL